ncbi:MAG: hypothetical protein WC485_00340 [Opitutaceae bacterium]
MRIDASVGRAPKSVSLCEQVYKLTLTADTEGEKQWLAGLLPAIEGRLQHIRLKKTRPDLVITEIWH